MVQVQKREMNKKKNMRRKKKKETGYDKKGSPHGDF